ncbi:LysR family transcriptional regulator [Verticiella sediminum]|uniref:LysR family transcriptional regulator n=1 Tax=Verticiella sediminum TaxID=1247510 RepID=A0A556AED5_9BURK|nr:LysR family transcriptional regulator [Verticiella sediminum]TSH91223.1 LysR family transcriptional regulator [Verticiella sediminum]
MELRHLRSFLTVARERNFTRAAALLHIAQPPLSLRIRELEEDIGVRLFERSTRHVDLTPAGVAFQQRVTELLMLLDRAVEDARRAHDGLTGTLRIGYTGRASHAVLPQLIGELRLKLPDVRLDLVGPGSSGPLAAELLRGNVDVALCFLPVQGESVRTRSLSEVEFVVALPATHRLASRAKVPIKVLREEPFVAYPADQGLRLREAVDDECERAGFLPRVVKEASTSQVLLCLVAAGTGVAIIPREIQDLDAIEGVVCREIEPQPRRLAHGIAWREDNPNPALRRLLELDAVSVGIRPAGGRLPPGTD